MRILHLTKKYPDALGGDAVVVWNLQQQQEAAGHMVSIVTSNCDEIIRSKNIYTFGLKDTPAGLDAITPRRLISLVMLFWKMFIVLRTVRPTIIHTHSVDMAFFASFAARWYKIPMVHTFHIVTFNDPQQSPLRRKTELWLAKHSLITKATAPNTYDVAQLQASGLTTQLLPNGVDTAFWAPKSTKKPSSIFTFVAFGRLEQQKGYEHLIKAAAKITAPAFKILIAGEGSARARLEKQVKNAGLQKSVFFVGRKNPHQIRDILAEADAAVFPALYETTPLTLLEAWAMKIPVISTATGILRDVPADFAGAYIVPVKNADALAKAMVDCMQNQQKRDLLATNGHTEVVQYGWPRIAQTAANIYQTTL